MAEEYDEDETIFTPSDFEQTTCSSECPWIKVAKTLEKRLMDKDKEIVMLKTKILHNEAWKIGMKDRWNAICDQNYNKNKTAYELETENVDLEGKLCDLQNKLENEQEKYDDQKEENAELIKQRDLALSAFQELVSGIHLLTYGDKDKPKNKHVKSVLALTNTIFSDFVDNYCAKDTEMQN